MFTLPLCVITCFAFFILAMLALCHIVWFSSFFCIFASLFICSCMHHCVLVCVIKLSSYVQSHAGSIPSLYTRSRVPFGNFAWWYVCRSYSKIMELWTPIQTYICPSRTSFLVFLFTPWYVPFPCLPICVLSLSLLSLLLVCWLCVFLVVACTCLERGHNFQNANQKRPNASKKMQA